MKNVYLLSGMIVLSGIVANVDAMETERPEFYQMIDALVGEPNKIYWPAIFAVLDEMQGAISVNEYRSPWGTPLLQYAVREELFDVAKTLLEKYHANPNMYSIYSDGFKETPLATALRHVGAYPKRKKRETTMIKLLLMHGANPNLPHPHIEGNYFDYAEQQSKQYPIMLEVLKIMEPYRQK